MITSAFSPHLILSHHHIQEIQQDAEPPRANARSAKHASTLHSSLVSVYAFKVNGSTFVRFHPGHHHHHQEHDRVLLQCPAADRTRLCASVYLWIAVRGDGDGDGICVDAVGSRRGTRRSLIFFLFGIRLHVREKGGFFSRSSSYLCPSSHSRRQDVSLGSERLSLCL